jgi:hypothetical protein
VGSGFLLFEVFALSPVTLCMCVAFSLACHFLLGERIPSAYPVLFLCFKNNNIFLF